MYILLLLLIRAVLQKFKHAKNGPRLIFKKVWLHAILFLAVLFLAMLYRNYVDSGKTSKNIRKNIKYTFCTYSSIITCFWSQENENKLRTSQPQKWRKIKGETHKKLLVLIKTRHDWSSCPVYSQKKIT